MSMNRKAIPELALSLAFLTMICLPFLVSVLGRRESTASIEKRELAARPDPSLMLGSLSRFGSQFESYFNDSFGLRRQLIRWNNLARLKVFDESPVKGVRKGREGWLYYADEWVLEDYENVMPYRPRDLERIAGILEQRRVWLERRGIRFFVVIAPNKPTIYPEYLPPAIHKLGRESRLDQVCSYMKAHPQIELIDLRAALWKEKPAQRLFHRTDSHWNDYGAFIGYEQVMDRIRKYFPALKKLSLDDFTVSAQEGKGGDLARLLSLDDVIKEERIILTPRFSARAKDGARSYEDPVHHPGRDMVVKETGDPSLPRVLVFRDSYSWGLIPYLSESFQSSVFIWTFEFLADIIEREKPDVVILESVERYLNSLTIENPEEVKKGL